MNDQVALFTSEVTRVASEVSTEVEARRPGRGTRPFTLAMYYLVNDQQAPAWWTLADAEGNEADVGTWMRPVLPRMPRCPRQITTLHTSPTPTATKSSRSRTIPEAARDALQDDCRTPVVWLGLRPMGANAENPWRRRG